MHIPIPIPIPTPIPAPTPIYPYSNPHLSFYPWDWGQGEVGESGEGWGGEPWRVGILFRIIMFLFGKGVGAVCDPIIPIISGMVLSFSGALL